MRVLLVSDYAARIGGAEIRMLALQDGLRQRGHDARVFASSARPPGAHSLADYECLGTTSPFRTLLQTLNPSAFWRLRQVLHEFRPDVVHVWLFLTQLSPLILPLLRRVPSLYYVVWYRPVCPLGTKILPDGTDCRVRAGAACYRSGCLPLREWLPLMLQMKLWRRWRPAFDLIAANSEATRQRLKAEGIEPVEIVTPGVRPRPPRKPLRWPPTVAFAGRLVRQKGVDILLRAFAEVVRQVPDARLLVAGEGPDRESLNQQIRTLGLASSVSMLGHLSCNEIESCFAGAWVQTVPSRTEAFGLVAAEAMMRGTAVVASARDGLTEIVRHGETGLLAPPGNVEALAAALLTLVGNRDLAERMGAAGRERALACFQEAACIDRFVGLYRSLIREAS